MSVEEHLQKNKNNFQPEATFLKDKSSQTWVSWEAVNQHLQISAG